MVYDLPQIPYSCRTIFSSCIHPLSFFLFVRNTHMNIIVKWIIPFKIHNWNKLLNWLCTNTHTHTQGVSGGRSIFWEVMVSVILSKYIHMNMCSISSCMFMASAMFLLNTVNAFLQTEFQITVFSRLSRSSIHYIKVIYFSVFIFHLNEDVNNTFNLGNDLE